MQTQNLQIVPKGVKPIIRASQSDVGRTFQLHLYDGATEYTPPTGTTLRLDGIKPDKTAFSYTDNLTLSGSVITVTCKTQMTLIPGTVQCEIRMTKDSEDIGTINFDLMVEKSPINGTTDLSQTEVPALVALARAEMEDAEAWAAGTKDGVPVGPDDPQYHNNAKYWAEQISGDGQEAEAWAIGTKSGVPVPSTDPQYHNNAKYYAQEAGSSATTAGTAATNASSSAQSASTSANAAGTSASNAAAAASRAEAAVVHGPYIGANGNWYVFDFTTQQYTDTNVKAQGPQGPQGIQGLPGEDGTNGTDGVGIVSITKTATQGLVDTYTVLLTNEQTYTFTVTNGQNGTGSGDMMAANYDPNQAVYNAGGIVAYVAAQISGLSISLNRLTDVALTSLAAGQSLIYDATEQKWVNGSISASNVNYTNTTSGLTATKVQNAIDEVAAKNQTLTKNVDVLIENGAVNRLPFDLNKCKALNTTGTWSNNTYALNGVSLTVNSDGTISVITESGGSTASTQFILFESVANWHNMMLSGAPSTASATTYDLAAYDTQTTGENSCRPNDIVLTNITDGHTIRVFIRVRSGQIITEPITFKPMIADADYTGGYVPYAKTNRELTTENEALTNKLSDEVETRAELGAHNLMPFDLAYVKSKNITGSWSNNVYTHNGVTFTCNIDSKGNLVSIGVSANPSTGDGILYLNRDLETILKSGGNYILNGVSGGASDTYKIGLSQKGFDENGDFPFVSNFTITGVSCWIQVASGKTVNTTIYPMIRDAKDTDPTYQPYAMTNRELTEKIGVIPPSNLYPFKFYEGDSTTFEGLPNGVWAISTAKSTRMTDKPSNYLSGRIYCVCTHTGDENFILAFNAQSKKCWIKFQYGTWAGWYEVALTLLS